MRRVGLVVATLILAACDTGHTPVAQPSTTGTPPASATATTVPTTTTTTNASQPPVPGGFVAMDMSWVSTEHGWVLGYTERTTAPPASILETRDGGRTWARLPAPKATIGAPTSSNCDSAPCVYGIRFANAEMGWVFGPRLFVTTDGGRHWSEESTPPVQALEPAGGQIFRVVANQPSSQCLPGCPYHVERAALGSSSWQRPTSPPFGGGRVELLVDGPRVYAIGFKNPAGGAQDAHSSLVRSLDAGQTWQKLDDPCGIDVAGQDRSEHDGISFSAAAARVLAVLCWQRVGDAQFVLVSTDAGATWSKRRTVPGRAFVVSAASSRVMSLWQSGQGQSEAVATSHDGGRTWRTALTVDKLTGPAFLAYQDGRTARASRGGPELWTTHDAGLSWSATEFTP